MLGGGVLTASDLEASDLEEGYSCFGGVFGGYMYLSIIGIGGCRGVAIGRARVVTDSGELGDLGPGDVLIAPLIDPAWTPLFVPVEAIVVDVGGQMSHAVIVSRGLGRPCVFAATYATRPIPDGAMVSIDGNAGTVTVVELADRA